MKLLNKVKDTFWQILQPVLIFLVYLFPYIFDIKSKIEPISKPSAEIMEIIISIVFKENLLIGAYLAILLFLWLRHQNASEILNKGNQYHDHSYLFYFYCSKILNYKKCSLKLVPIAMQFRLVLNDTFCEFDYGNENEYPTLSKENADIEVTFVEGEVDPKIINLVISDTYPIDNTMLPSAYLSYPTYFIQRKSNILDKSRYYCPSLINETRNIVQKQNEKCIFNIFATTNPMNSFYLIKNVFQTADRGKIKELRVFKQNRGESNNWNFYGSGDKIKY